MRNNRFVIPWSWADGREFYERLTHPLVQTCQVGEKSYQVVTERLLPGYHHLASADELQLLLAAWPEADLNGLELIVLRQPKHKEEVLSAAWGRFVSEYRFRGRVQPAVILEAGKNFSLLTLPRPLPFHWQSELAFLRTQGVAITEAGSTFSVKMPPEVARHTRLYHTLAHEIGHYVQYRKCTEGAAGPSFWSIPTREGERFAENYAARRIEEFRRQNLLLT
jgi:hypothetical protein